MEEWVNLNTFDYDLECNRCNKKFTVIQHGKPLNKVILEKILLEAHVKNTYDAFSYFHVTKNAGIIRVEVDVLKNEICK